MAIRRAALVCVFGLALSSTAAAQERKGFWFSFGLGIGSIDVSAKTPAGRPFQEGREGGGVVDLDLGWALNSQLLSSLEIKFMAATSSGGQAELDISNVSGALTYYPRPSSNFFVKGGVGGSFLEFHIDDAPLLAVDAGKGFGFSAGAGYDIYIGRGFSLTPAASFWYGHPGDLRLDGQPLLKDWRHNVIHATLAIKFN